MECVTLYINEREYPNVAISRDGDRCLYFFRRSKNGEAMEGLFVFFDYQVERIREHHFLFFGYQEVEGSIPGRELYRYVKGEYISERSRASGPEPGI